MRTRVIAAVLVVVAAGAVAVFYPRGGGSAVAFRTEPTRRGELIATVSGTGTLEPEEVIDVGSQVAGQIKEFGLDLDGHPIDYGSRVDKTTVLARIDDNLYAAKVAQSKATAVSAEQKVIQAKAKVAAAVANTNKARADLLQAKARSAQSTRDWGRVKAISSAVSGAESDAALSAFETNAAAVTVADAAIAQMVASEADARAAVGDAEAAVATANAVLKQDEINLGYCVIQSPLEGVIIDRRVTVGQTVQPAFNTPSLFLIAKDLRRMAVWASVNESDFGQIRKGQAVKFTVDAFPADTFAGTVGRIRLNATNTNNVVQYTVEVTTDNQSGRLPPYMTATLKFEADRRTDALLVPNAAVRYRPSQQAKVVADAVLPKANGAAVWVEEGGKLRPIPITLGLTDGTMTEVLAGDLAADTPVVVGETRKAAVPSASENPFATPKMGGTKKQ